MSQQYQQPTGSVGQETYGGEFGQQSMQSPYGTGSQMKAPQTGQQHGSAHRFTHESVGRQFESEMTAELNEALESFDRVVEIAEWCADKCIDGGPEMAECARLCEDLADLASLNERFIARDSINGPEVAEAFLRVAEQGMPILRQHQQAPHVQETLSAVSQAVDSTNKLLNSIGHPQTGGSMGAGQTRRMGGRTQQMGGRTQQMGGRTQQMGGRTQQMGGQY